MSRARAAARWQQAPGFGTDPAPTHRTRREGTQHRRGDREFDEDRDGNGLRRLTGSGPEEEPRHRHQRRESTKNAGQKDSAQAAIFPHLGRSRIWTTQSRLHRDRSIVPSSAPCDRRRPVQHQVHARHGPVSDTLTFAKEKPWPVGTRDRAPRNPRAGGQGQLRAIIPARGGFDPDVSGGVTFV